MTITIKSGLVALVAAVAADFAAKGVTAVVELGFKRRWRQDNQGTGQANRVLFIPAGNDGGSAGSLTYPKFTGDRAVRVSPSTAAEATISSLANWERACTVAIWAADSSDLENESLQIEAAETLLENTMRAVYGAPGAFANVAWGDVTFVPPRERGYGQEVLVGLTFAHPVYAAPRSLYYPTVVTITPSFDVTFTPPTPGGDT